MEMKLDLRINDVHVDGFIGLVMIGDQTTEHQSFTYTDDDGTVIDVQGNNELMKRYERLFGQIQSATDEFTRYLKEKPAA